MIHDLRQVLGKGGEAVAGELHRGLRIVSVEAEERGMAHDQQEKRIEQAQVEPASAYI